MQEKLEKALAYLSLSDAQEKTWTYTIAILLFLLLFSSGCINALNRSLWGDELHGIYGALQSQSFWHLLVYGPFSEASPSPLTYLIDRVWTNAWSNTPHYHWNVFLFYRIQTILAACATVLAVYFYTITLWERFAKQNWPQTLKILIATAVATFFHYNSLLQYFAIENRPYSMWVFFSTLHLVCLLEFFLSSEKQDNQDGQGRQAIPRTLSPIYWLCYAVVCLLMVLTTFSSIAQIFAGLLAQIYFAAFHFPPKKQKETWPKLAMVFTPSLVLATWYYLQIKPINYDTSGHTLVFYFQSLAEVLAKTFHHHGTTALWITAPLVLLAIPLWQARKQPWIRAIFLFSTLLLTSTFCLFLASKWKGGLFGAKYMINTVPLLSFLYFYALFSLFSGLARLITKKQKTEIAAATVLLLFLSLWSVAEVGGRGAKLLGKLYHEGSILLADSTYSTYPAIQCPASFGRTEQKVIQQVQTCRKSLD